MSSLPQNRITAIAEAAHNPNVIAFLRVIRAGETSQDDDAYRMLYGGELIADLSDHPRKRITKKLGGKSITSTAAGAYQFLSRTWDECKKALEITDFSPRSQDIAAVYLINRRGALDDVIMGRFESALRKCAHEWASLPGSPYGQPTKTITQARAVYEQYGGEYETSYGYNQSTETPMPIPAFIAAALPALIEAAPKLGRIFSSGSETSERNVQAAEMVLDIAKQAVGASNEQALVETIKTDPTAAQTVRDAIDANWWRIDEVGGGIEAARKANISQSSIEPRRNMALWVTIMLLPLIYMTVIAVLFTGDWTSETKAMVVAAVISGVLSAITGYWLGTSFSSAKKDDRLGVIK